MAAALAAVVFGINTVSSGSDDSRDTVALVDTAAASGGTSGGASSNVTSSNSGQGQAPATTSTGSSGGSVTSPPPAAAPSGSLSQGVAGGPSFAVGGGSESRYSSDYVAQVDSVSGLGYLITVDFRASGRSDLRRPETACIRIDGTDGNDYIALPVDMRLSVEQSTDYVGSLTFPALISGQYRFNYSCASDYGLADLGSVTVPNQGISRYSSSYYAVVFGSEGNSILFASHGPFDLRDPDSSCLEGSAGEDIRPSVDLDYSYSEYSLTYIGRMNFASIPPNPTFVYSCSYDYTGVPVGS